MLETIRVKVMTLVKDHGDEVSSWKNVHMQWSSIMIIERWHKIVPHFLMERGVMKHHKVQTGTLYS